MTVFFLLQSTCRFQLDKKGATFTNAPAAAELIQPARLVHTDRRETAAVSSTGGIKSKLAIRFPEKGTLSSGRRGFESNQDSSLAPMAHHYPGHPSQKPDSNPAPGYMSQPRVLPQKPDSSPAPGYPSQPRVLPRKPDSTWYPSQAQVLPQKSPVTTKSRDNPTGSGTLLSTLQNGRGGHTAGTRPRMGPSSPHIATGLEQLSVRGTGLNGYHNT